MYAHHQTDHTPNMKSRNRMHPPPPHPLSDRREEEAWMENCEDEDCEGDHPVFISLVYIILSGMYGGK